MPGLFANLPRRVSVVEVGPRDGLQNERVNVPTADKIRFVNLLSAARPAVLEVTSFVSPKAVPNLADAAEVFAGIERRPGVRYTALVPNRRGLERALAVGVPEVAVVTAASETFNQRNINMTIAESLERIAEVVALAREHGVPVRGYVSVSFGCPYEGRVAPERVWAIAERLLEVGCAEIALGDTIGVATPNQVEEVVAPLLERVPAGALGLHFHDTRGTALANVLTALLLGVATFDSSAGGLGGCPFAPGAAGNLATEDLLYLLAGLGVETGMELDAVRAASAFIAARLDHPLTSKVYQACAASGRAGPERPA
jgi:isopropylmalate/homocitrate/citramalate synthase